MNPRQGFWRTTMFKATRFLPVLLAAVVSVATPACAGAVYSQRYPPIDRDDRAYYNRGYREGRESGVEDARRGRSYDLRRHGEYRDNRRGDDRGDLRAFRQGFETGYDEGYRLYARGGYGSAAPNYPRSSGPYDGGGSRGRVYGGAASQNGYRDGFEAGERAGRKGDRFDPVREKRYRDGDHDYDRRDGSREEYKRGYRSAFQQGYDDGYRSYRR
jgi:hypothetical protein